MPDAFVNQTFPSDPVATSVGPAGPFEFPAENSFNVPSGLILPNRPDKVNHTPSERLVMPKAVLRYSLPYSVTDNPFVQGP